MKNKTPNIFIIASNVLLLATLSSCSDHEFTRSGVDPSFVSAEITIQNSNKAKGDKQTISSDKMRGISKWFEKHRSGWSLIAGTPPPSSDIQIDVAYADGHHARLDVLTGDKYPVWHGTIIKWDVDSSVQNFPDVDFISLLELIKKKDAPP